MCRIILLLWKCTTASECAAVQFRNVHASSIVASVPLVCATASVPKATRMVLSTDLLQNRFF